MPKQYGELKRSKSYDELLLSGIKAIAAQGIDHITVGDVTKLSHHSRPTFYTYFGDMNGFLAELWLKYGIEWLDSLVSNPPERIPPTELNAAMMEILLVSHRNLEIAEVLAPDIQAWFERNSEANPVKAVKLSWYLAVKLGMYLSLPVTPEAIAAIPFLAYLNSIPDNVLSLDGMQDLAKNPMQPRPQMLGLETTSEDVELKLLASSIDVVANSGFVGASMARIARRARVSTGTLYPRYKTTENIIAASFDHAIKQIVRGNVQQLETNVGADQFGEIVVAGFHDSRKSWRNYRLEMYLEAQHNPAIAKYMAPGLEETRLLLDGNLKQYGFSDEQRLSITQMMQNQAVGLSLLFNAGVPVEKFDHRIPSRYIALMMPK